MPNAIPVVVRPVPAASAAGTASKVPVDTVFVGAEGEAVDVVNVCAPSVPKAAGAAPTKAEFDALIDALVAAGLMKSAESGA